MSRAKRVPETGVRVEHARMHLPVIRTEIGRLTLFIVFVEAVGIDYAPIERAVERAALIFRTAFDTRPAQSFVPGFFRAAANGVKIGLADFLLHVAQGLLRADER